MSQEIKYIGMDFETGGVDPSVNPILTGYFCALDKDLNTVDELSLKIRPNDKYNVVEEGALKVNGIIMEQHVVDPETVSYEEASAKLRQFLRKNGGGKNSVSKQKTKPRPLGHNVNFDIDFSRQLLTKDEWQDYLHYGNLCTFSVLNFLKDIGLLPQTLGNLISIVKHFNIKELDAHTAKSDVIMMVQVYSAMVNMIKNSVNNSSGLDVDILSMLEK